MAACFVISTIKLQVITMECPTALVWNNIGEGKHNYYLNYSPLDLSPCAPSSLPMPPGSENAQVRKSLFFSQIASLSDIFRLTLISIAISIHVTSYYRSLCTSQIRSDLRVREHEIRQRSRAAEMRWSSDKWQQTTAGLFTS